MVKLILATATALVGTAAIASQPSPPTGPVNLPANAPGVVCKYVVADGRARDNKPYQLCQSEKFWAAKQAADDKNASHVECHYQEVSGSRLRVGKRCMTADMWRQERQMTADYVQSIQAATQGPH